MTKLSAVVLAGVISITVAGAMAAPAYATYGPDHEGRTSQHTRESEDNEENKDYREHKSGTKNETENEDRDDKHRENRGEHKTKNQEHKEDEKRKDREHKKDDGEHEAKPVAATQTPTKPTTLPAVGIGGFVPVAGILASIGGYFGYLLHLKRKIA